MTFEEINEKWKRSSLNFDGLDFPKKSFHNYLQSLEEMFGIEIVCDRRNGYRYSIDVDQMEDQLTLDILHKLIMRFAFIEDGSMKCRIMDLDHSLSLPKCYFETIDAISNHSIITLTQYDDFSEVFKEYPQYNKSYIQAYRKKENLLPLGIVKADEDWFVIGKDATDHNKKVIKLSNVIELSVTGKVDNYEDEDFSVEQFINQFEYSVSYSLSVNDDSALFNVALGSAHFRKERRENP